MIAVVVTGLILGHKAPIIQDATSRLNERINWETIQFLLENSVFLLIGLQLRGILDDVVNANLPAPTIAVFCVGTLAAVVLSRPLWVFPVSYLLVKPTDERGQRVSWKRTAIISWAGMRGVVTLAAAFVLLQQAIPQASVLVLGAFVVTAGTLLLQGLSLPWLARRLDVRGPDEREDALQEATVLRSAAAAGRAELDRIVTPEDDEATVAMLRRRGETRANVVWERLGGSEADETPSEQYRRLRLAMLAAERNEVLKIRHSGTVDSDVLTERDGHPGRRGVDDRPPLRPRRSRRRPDPGDACPYRRRMRRPGERPRGHRPADPRRMPGLPAGGPEVGAPAVVPGLRQCRLL